MARRTRDDPVSESIQSMIVRAAPMCVRRLVGIAKSAPPQLAIRACELLLAYAHGKPTERVEANVNVAHAVDLPARPSRIEWLTQVGATLPAPAKRQDDAIEVN